jgi:hypothetical protein
MSAKKVGGLPATERTCEQESLGQWLPQFNPG